MPSHSVGPVETNEETRAGNYFVSNYPPFHFWDPATAKHLPELLAVPASSETPLGVYFHIPFCRKRCHFCYFRVYTDKNAGEIQRTLMQELLSWKGTRAPLL